MQMLVRALFLLLALPGEGKALSLSVSLCYQQGDYQKTMQCLIAAYEAAEAARTKAQEDAGRRLGPEQKAILDRTMESWRAAIAEDCKAAGPILKKGDTDWECLIDVTHARTRELSEIGR